MVYIFVSGGSFGIEEMVSSSGPGLTLLLLVTLPVFWAMPMALAACELGSAMPNTGFYDWTKRALGPFWGFLSAWWWTLATLVDTSIICKVMWGLTKTYFTLPVGSSSARSR